MNDGIQKYNRGSLRAATRLLERSATRDPSNHRAMFYRGLILNELGRSEESPHFYEDAVRALQDSLKLASDDAETHYQLGVAYTGLTQYSSALSAYSAAVRIRPHGEALYRSGLIHLEEERYNQAQESFREAIKAKPELGLSYTALSQLYRRFKKMSAAITVLKNAIENDPEDLGHFRDLGEIYASLQQYSKAVELYEKALESSSSNSHLTFLLAEAYYKMGDRQSAEIQIKKFIRMRHTRADRLLVSKAKELLRELNKKRK